MVVFEMIGIAHSLTAAGGEPLVRCSLTSGCLPWVLNLPTETQLAKSHALPTAVTGSETKPICAGSQLRSSDIYGELTLRQIDS